MARRKKRVRFDKVSKKGAAKLKRARRRSGRKLTKAQRREISIRNLNKGRRRSKGKRKSKRSKTKSPRRRSRTSRAIVLRSETKPTRRRRKRRFTAKARAAALRNLGKARSKRRRMKRAGRKHKVRAYSYKPKCKTRRVKAHRSYEKAPRRRKRRTGGRRRRQTEKQRRASMRNLRKARRARRGGSRRRSSVSRRSGSRRRHYAMENPLDGMEIFVGGLTMLVGFLSADFTDRILATHTLQTNNGSGTATGTPLTTTVTAAGQVADVPPTTGDYANLFNATAIAAPMNIPRWGAGLGFTIVPVVVANFVQNPVGRSALQMFGFGAGARILGKGLIDLVAMLTVNTPMGMQLYDGEMVAQALASNNTTEISMLPGLTNPSSGVTGVPRGMGKPRGVGCACVNCQTGVGRCHGVGGATGMPLMSPQQAATSSGSNVTPPSAPGNSVVLQTPALPAPVVSSGPASVNGSPLQGVPMRRNPYAWGREEAA